MFRPPIFFLLFLDVAMLGLTVLAIGNSFGDLVANTAIARAGRPAMVCHLIDLLVFTQSTY